MINSQEYNLFDVVTRFSCASNINLRYSENDGPYAPSQKIKAEIGEFAAT